MVEVGVEAGVDPEAPNSTGKAGSWDRPPVAAGVPFKWTIKAKQSHEEKTPFTV